MNQRQPPLTHRPGLPLAVWALLFSLIGFGLRMQRLDFQPLWGDEGWSFYFASLSLPDLLALTAADIHPPLYYLFLKGWLFLLGTGPEEARLLSVMVGVLLIPVLSILGQRLFDARVGAAAGAVTAVMPLAVYYSQEVRMYGLVTLLGALATYFLIRAGQFPSRHPFWNRWGLAYVFTLAAALYTMYYAAFLFLCQFLYLGAVRLRRERLLWQAVYRVLLLFTSVVFLYLPWVFYISTRLPAYIQNKRDVEGYVALNIIRFLGDHLVAFSLGHLPPLLRLYVWMALPFVLMAALGFMGVLYERRKQAIILYLYLFVPLFLGYLVNQVFPFTPPFFERTLLLAAPAYWLLIAAGLVWLWDWQYLLVGTAVVTILIATVICLISFYTLPRYPNSDYRPLLKEVAARATPEDTLLASYQWQLGFYQAYLPPPRPRFFVVPGWGQGWAGAAGRERRMNDLQALLAGTPRLWFPAYQAAGHLWEDEAEMTLVDLGYPALLQWYSPEIKLTLVGAAADRLAEAPGTNFEDELKLLAAGVGQGRYEAGRGIIPIELTWQKRQNLGSEHRVSLRLVDAAGRTWASRDSHPRAGQAFFTDLALNESLPDRHGLLVSAGTPPGRYRLLLSVQRVADARPMDRLDDAGQPQGVELLLAEVEVIDPDPAVGPAALPVQVATDAQFGRTARLVGYSLGDGPFKAGETLPLNLFWLSLADQPEPLRVSLQLLAVSGETAAAYEAEPIRPASEWWPGFILRDPHDVPLPPTLPPGQYRLVVSLVRPGQPPLEVEGGSSLVLTTIKTTDRPRVFTPPDPGLKLDASFNGQARLVGLDLPGQVIKAGETLPLTLYWQAAAPLGKNWTVFVHLVDGQGRIISQQDQVPGAGQFPTAGWLSGEYLADSYSLLIPADTPPGQAYTLEIGLYDVNDFSRLGPVVEGGKNSGDHLTLEKWPITID